MNNADLKKMKSYAEDLGESAASFKEMGDERAVGIALEQRECAKIMFAAVELIRKLQDKWIPITPKSMPEAWVNVWWGKAGKDSAIGEMACEEVVYHDEGLSDMSDWTHWQPLIAPEPPVAEQIQPKDQGFLGHYLTDEQREELKERQESAMTKAAEQAKDGGGDES